MHLLRTKEFGKPNDLSCRQKNLTGGSYVWVSVSRDSRAGLDMPSKSDYGRTIAHLTAHPMNLTEIRNQLRFATRARLDADSFPSMKGVHVAATIFVIKQGARRDLCTNFQRYREKETQREASQNNHRTSSAPHSTSAASRPDKVQ